MVAQATACLEDIKKGLSISTLKKDVHILKLSATKVQALRCFWQQGRWTNLPTDNVTLSKPYMYQEEMTL